jgi:chaperonin GroEL
VAGHGDRKRIDERVATLKRHIEAAGPGYERDALTKRLAKLAGGVAVIRVGAATETALHERKNRFQDALHATRATVEEGIVPGGGVALLRGRQALEDARDTTPEELRTGAKIVHDALAAPRAKSSRMRVPTRRLSFTPLRLRAAHTGTMRRTALTATLLGRA